MRALGACRQVVARIAEQNQFVAGLGAAIAEDLARRLTDLALTDDLGLG